MNPKEKDLAGQDICKIHSARSDKEFYRICPSKLSKRELEDLYYSLLENNLNLKRTVNGQNEKIKQLAVKVQRMTAQRGAISRDPKDCCSGAKAIIDEQKETIAELKKTNDVMSERIRQLNMRLCTAKQFLKRNPNKAATRCYKCFAGSYMEASTSAKNLSTSAINTKSNENRSTAVSYQDLNKEISTTRSVETNTANMDENNKKEIHVKLCDENKCRTTMDELKQKIVDLQEELSKTHTEYSTRISQLEGQVSELQTINIRVRSERVASEHRLQAKTEAEACMARLVKDAEIRKAELSMLLTIERKKVSELEMQLKSARMSGEVARAVQRHLSTTSLAADTSFPDSQQNIKDSLQVIRDRKDQTKSSDDSGYDHERSHNDKSFTKMDEVLIKRIADLQIQLEKLKETAVARETYQPNEQSANDDSEFINIDRRDVSDYEYVIGPTKEVILEIEQVKGNVERAEKDDPIKSTGLETVVRFQESKIKLRSSTPQKDLKNEQKKDLEQSENFQEPKQFKIGGEELKQIQGMSQVNKYQDSDKVDDRVCQEVSEYSQGVDDDDKLTRIDDNKGSNLENKPSKKKLKRTATNEIQERSSKHKEVCNSEERSKKRNEDVYSSEEEKRDKKKNEEVSYSEEEKSKNRNGEVIYSKKNEDVYSSEEEKRGRKKHEEVSCNEEDKRSKGRKSWKKLIVECRQDINKNEPNKKYTEVAKEVGETRKTDKGNEKHVCQCVNCPKKLNGKTVGNRLWAHVKKIMGHLNHQMTYVERYKSIK